MKKFLRNLFVLAIWLAVHTAVLYAQPANDQCGNGTLLTTSTTCTATAGTLRNAIGGNGASPCIPVDRPDVWYRFVATSTQHEVRVTGSASIDLVISAFNACGGTIPTGGNCVDGSGDGGVETLYLSNLIIGNEYFIRVQDFYGNISAASTFTICVIHIGPANDQCANATSLTPAATCTNTAGTLQNAFGGNGANGCIGADRPDVWYKFVATRTQHQVTAAGSANVDLTISAFTACGGAIPTGGNCSENSGDGAAENLFLSNLTIGNTYYIRIQDFYGNVSPTSTFTVCVLASPPLPLELVSFTGQVQPYTNTLYWETQSEENVDFHAVERSTNGRNWQEIGRKNGLLHSTATVKYTLEDRLPLAKACYRLRSVDIDGAEQYSSLLWLSRKEDAIGSIQVFPSPASDHITLHFNAGQGDMVILRIVDMTGRLVREQSVSTTEDMNETQIKVSDLAAGIYMLKAESGKENFASIRFVKQ